MEELKQFTESINSYEIQQVNMNSILGIKKLADNINNFEKQYLWKDFETKFNSIILNASSASVHPGGSILYISKCVKSIRSIFPYIGSKLKSVSSNFSICKSVEPLVEPWVINIECIFSFHLFVIIYYYKDIN